MSITLYYGSGSPYAWRAWLALEHKQLPYTLKMVSFSAGDLMKPDFLALNPHHKVPVILDEGFSLYESAAIVEYLEDAYPEAGERLFPAETRERALVRRLIREADQYVAGALDKMIAELLFKTPEKWNQEVIQAGKNGFAKELAHFESNLSDRGFLMGVAGAADFTLYPLVALALRLDIRKPDLNIRQTLGPNVSAWMKRVEALPYFEKTFPPHWKES